MVCLNHLLDVAEQILHLFTYLHPKIVHGCYVKACMERDPTQQYRSFIDVWHNQFMTPRTDVCSRCEKAILNLPLLRVKRCPLQLPSRSILLKPRQNVNTISTAVIQPQCLRLLMPLILQSRYLCLTTLARLGLCILKLEEKCRYF